MYASPSGIIHWSTYPLDITAIFFRIKSNSQFFLGMYCIDKNIMLIVHSHFLVFFSQRYNHLKNTLCLQYLP
ncbi:hypothetical protein BvCmsHHP054_04928 [Escherichia coli]|nr:hypothetical protein BvCmsHHP054_04928 [Escherichia coli]